MPALQNLSRTTVGDLANIEESRTRVPTLHETKQGKNAGWKPALRISSRGWREFAEPDVAVADGMVVVLESEREFVGACRVRRSDVMAGGTG